MEAIHNVPDPVASGNCAAEADLYCGTNLDPDPSTVASPLPHHQLLEFSNGWKSRMLVGKLNSPEIFKCFMKRTKTEEA